MPGLSSSPSYMTSPMYVSPPAAQSVRYPTAIGTGLPPRQLADTPLYLLMSFWSSAGMPVSSET